jgi:guanylate kinase
MSKYIIVGPGASGKDWMLQKMKELGYHPMKQYTTREIRENETGDEYHFVSEDVFKDMDDHAKFISVNFYRIGWYGVSYDELVDSDVAILSPANVKDIFTTMPRLRDRFTIIYLDIPVSIRRERLNARYTNKVGDDNEVRLANDERDFKDFSLWDIRFEDVKSIDDFINNLSPKSKGDED